MSTTFEFKRKKLGFLLSGSVLVVLATSLSYNTAIHKNAQALYALMYLTGWGLFAYGLRFKKRDPYVIASILGIVSGTWGMMYLETLRLRYRYKYKKPLIILLTASWISLGMSMGIRRRVEEKRVALGACIGLLLALNGIFLLRKQLDTKIFNGPGMALYAFGITSMSLLGSLT